MNLDFEQQIEKWLKEGFQHFLNDDYQSALYCFSQVLNLDEENPMANSFAAACLNATERAEEAEPLARKGVQNAPQVALAHFYLASVLASLNKNDEAESELWEAVAAEPQQPAFQIELSRFHIVHGKYKEGEEIVSRLQVLFPQIAESYFLLSLSRCFQNQYLEAETPINQALSLEPQNPTYLAFKGIIQAGQAMNIKKAEERTAMLQTAQDFLRTAKEHQPQDVRIATALEQINKAKWANDDYLHLKSELPKAILQVIGCIALLFVLGYFWGFSLFQAILYGAITIATLGIFAYGNKRLWSTSSTPTGVSTDGFLKLPQITRNQGLESQIAKQTNFIIYTDENIKH
ncbi:MAG: tetratricopeptide repeat protein [Acidobacteriota bacterium]